METIPVLAREKILCQVSAEDLMACSLVSVAWRDAVNCDHVWKKVCMKTCNKTTIDYVTTAQSLVATTFQEPECLESLEPLCYWRVVYMKLQHVRRNWQRGNHETYRVTDMAYNFYDIRIHNNILVANVNDNECEVWNIRGAPRKLETVICALDNTRTKCLIHLFDDRLVIIQETLLQVYKKVKNRFSLCHRRLFNQPELCSVDIPGSLKVDDWYRTKVQKRLTSLQAILIGKYFIGLSQIGSYENTSFHVWDTVTGSKLKEEFIKNISPEIKDSVYNVKFCPPKIYLGKVLVCVQYFKNPGPYATDNTFQTVVYLYDLTSLTFKTLQVLRPHVPWIFYANQWFLTIDHNQVKLSIFDSSSGSMIASKCYEELINPDSVQVHDEYLGLTTGGDLVVLNIKKDFELVFTTGIVKFSSNLFGFDFVFLSWDLVLIACWDNVNKIEVWNVKEKTLLSTLKASGLIFPCTNSAKFFVWNEMVTTIYMLQFW